MRTHASGSSPPAGSGAAERWMWFLCEDSAELQGSAVSPPPPSQQQQQTGNHRAAPGRFDLVPIETAGCSSLVQREGTGMGGSRYGLFLRGRRGTGGSSLLGASWASPRGAPGYVSSVVASLPLPALPKITTRETPRPGSLPRPGECPRVGNKPGPVGGVGAWRGAGMQGGHPLLWAR